MGIKNSIPRLDAVDKVTGAAKYTEDLIPINALVGKTLHSTIANGTVRAIDVDEAWKIPGVVDILTCFDVPDWEYATCGHPLSLDPAHTDVANKRILTKRVRYYGDEIAAVVAESDLAAQKALEAIRVEYEELPPLLTPEAAVISGIPLHEKSPDNQGGRMDFIIDESQNVRFYQGTFSMDPCIGGYVDLRGTKFHVPAQQHCHIENICCFAYMSGRKIVVVSPNQAPHTLRKHISDALGIPTGRIRCGQALCGRSIRQ
ncbi:molybdopterin cofactor-binding domain-containing protein [Dysosmobacter welbionis]|uniref:molybdopterin cofactor-binding domain-containing protein n=1 Tax=Dysosmobacter welbionis TaxID=2093857 RepID=UPI00300EC07C